MRFGGCYGLNACFPCSAARLDVLSLPAHSGCVLRGVWKPRLSLTDGRLDGQID